MFLMLSKNYRNKGKWFIFALKNDSYLYSRRIHMCFQKGFIFALKNGFIFALKKDSYVLSRICHILLKRIHMCDQVGFTCALKNDSYFLLRRIHMCSKKNLYLLSKMIHICCQEGFIFALKKDSYLLSRRIRICSQKLFIFAIIISNNWNMRVLIIFEICIVRKMLRIILWSLNLVMSKINLQRLFKVEKNRWRCLR